MFGRRMVVREKLDDPAWTQPAIYALECALTALWQSVGIQAETLWLGTAWASLRRAQAAGVYGLEEGLRFAAARGELMAALPPGGAMAAVFAPEVQVVAAVDEWNSTCEGVGISIAAYNGAHQAISGPAAAVECGPRAL